MARRTTHPEPMQWRKRTFVVASFNWDAIGNRNDTIIGGPVNETIVLGAGTYNTHLGGKGHNICHLPATPSSWHGTAAANYHDTIVNCTVVSP
jgi:hypothetical protein